jgi:hypothetical protein
MMSDSSDTSISVKIAEKVRKAREKSAARQAEYRRRVFVVMHADELIERYGPIFEILLEQPDATEPTRHFELEDVLADIAVRYQFLTIDDPNLSGDGDEPSGFGSLDVAVWRDGRLLAVVRPADDGEPVVTHFDG